MFDLAARAEEELPDPVGIDEVERFGQAYGVSRDTLVSAMGGSP